jgi:putative endonuclease
LHEQSDNDRDVFRRGVAQPGSAPALGAGSRRFKSSRPDQKRFASKALTLKVPFLFDRLIRHILGGYVVVTLYVLKGETGKRYAGITNDLARRIKEHCSRHSKGGQILGDFSVVYTEIFDDYATARAKEKFLKSGQGRKWLDKLEAESEPAIKPAYKARL